MKVADKPKNEEQRIDYLNNLDLLNINKDEFIEEINFLASRLLGVPISLVTLIDTEKQWIKSALGTDLQETPRDISFCSHTILDEEPMIIEDATLDDRFVKNPLVNGQLNSIRFYAGAQIKIGKVNLGALCLIDTKPRKFSADDLKALKLLAGFISDYLEAKAETTYLNNELKEFNEKANAFNKDMAAKMCDKLNNKLAVISGVLEILNNKNKNDLSQREIELVEKSNLKVRDLAEDIKMLSNELIVKYE